MAETIFSKVDYDLGSLIKFIELGEIALPDIQRPFVWKNAKVRNLFDSMYRGYPVGYFLFWQNALAGNTREIGVQPKQKPARLLIVDGQQRLTSLYAVMRGIPVVREDYSEEKINLAFNPLTETFEVADAAILNNKLYIQNVSSLWAESGDIFEIVDDYLKAVSEIREVTSADKKRIRSSIQKVYSLTGYPLTAIELASDMNEEDVAEVFVRINSEGKKLNQADFILTLMSVYWEQGRKDLESFCKEARVPSTGKASPFNYFIKPDPDQLLRVAVGLAFRRARLRYVYAILRGKDLETEKYSDELRVKQFERLKDAQSNVLDLTNWHDYLTALQAAGFRSETMISSKTAVIYTYLLFLIGKVEFNVDSFELRKCIAQWFFMSALTGRYSSSPESKMEFDLANLRDIKNADEFCAVLKQSCEDILTRDYWSISLPSDLATAAGKSPTQLAYFASLNLMEANVLFSDQKVSDLMEPSRKAKRASIEKHHLFPKKHLATLGVTSRRQTNQLANYALVEWGDNAKASSKAPKSYLPEFVKRFDSKDLEQMYRWHALPDNWENMEYTDFLARRRELMAKIIQEAYEKLAGHNENDSKKIDLTKLVETGESDGIEFKSTLRVNLHTGKNDDRMEHAVLKTIVGFLNRDGGKLVIGLSDDGKALGFENDNFENEDKMNLHLVNLINTRIGKQFMIYITPRFEDYGDARAFVIDCAASRSPVYLKQGNVDSFYIRTGPSTTELSGGEMQEFIRKRFG